jgi:hypothetical protein
MRPTSEAVRAALSRRAPFVVALLLLSASAARAQQPAGAGSPEQELTVTDLLKLPGRVVGEASGERAAGPFKVKGYRVEELTLPRAIEVKIGGELRAVSRAFRLTVTGGPFPVRAMPPVIWVGDAAVGYGVENEELTEITAITYDESVLAEGATLYLSYGDKENKEDRTAVPVKLKLGGAKRGRQ